MGAKVDSRVCQDTKGRGCGRVLEISAFYEGVRLCKGCYSKHKPRYRHDISVTEKHCRKCNTTKAAGEFHSEAGNLDGLTTSCKVCRNAAAMTRRQEKPADKVEVAHENWRRYIRRRYGLSPVEVQMMVNFQSGLCPLCERPLPADLRRCAIDHCHGSGVVRGIIHIRCNSLLAGFDDATYRENALRYIQQTRTQKGSSMTSGSL